MRTVHWLAGLALVTVAARPAAGDEEFGPAQARALLPRAAAGDAAVLQIVSDLGAAVTQTDLQSVGTVPLTHLLLLAPWWAPDALRKDYRTLAATPVTPADLLPVFYGAPMDRTKERKHAFPSVLHDEYLTDVTCVRTGDTARGEVRFTAPGAYEGRAEWAARKLEGTWRIVEFVVPSWRLRVRLDAEKWVAERIDDPGARWFPTLEWISVASEELPVTGTVVDAPDRATYVAIAGDGALRFGGQEGGLDELSAWLRMLSRDPRQREPDGSSKIDLVVRFDRWLPWTLVQWVLMSATEAKIYRIHFAVRPEAGGEDGVLEAFLPRDRGGPVPTPHDVLLKPVVRANVFHGEGVPDLGAVFAAIRAQVQAGARTVELGTPPPKVPAAGHVVTLYDLALRAGAEQVHFVGAPMPSPRASPGTSAAHKPGSLPWLRAWVGRFRAQTPTGCVIKVGDTRFAAGPGASAKAAALPAPPPRRRAAPVAASLDDGPVETEEVVEEEMPEDTPPVQDTDEAAMADAPVEGPTDDDKIGLGGGAGGAFKGRGGSRPSTTPREADPAVDAALRWLAAHQAADGHWSCTGFASWCDGKPVPDAEKAGAGKSMYDVGVTGLSLLAFLGAGYSNRSEGPYGKVVASGLRFLKNEQDAEGCFGPRTSSHFAYNHAIASLAMVEAYGMTDSVIFKGAAQKAFDFVALCRNPYFAWRYGVKPGDNDTSVTGWMTMVLQSARLVNRTAVATGRPPPLAIDDEAFDGIRAWLSKMTDPEFGRVGYQQRGAGPARPTELVDRFPGEKSESMTAIGVLLRVFLGDDPATDDVVRKGVALLQRLPPTWNPDDGSVDFYYWHAATLAMHQVGGSAWTAWHEALRAAVVPHQRTDGDVCTVKGSWDPIDPWGSDGGRVYSTALLANTLLAPQRYERLPHAAK